MCAGEGNHVISRSLAVAEHGGDAFFLVFEIQILIFLVTSPFAIAIGYDLMSSQSPSLLQNCNADENSNEFLSHTIIN